MFLLQQKSPRFPARTLLCSLLSGVRIPVQGGQVPEQGDQLFPLVQDMSRQVRGPEELVMLPLAAQGEASLLVIPGVQNLTGGGAELFELLPRQLEGL